MPEAAVHKDDCAMTSKHKVGLAWQRLVVEPEAQAEAGATRGEGRALATCLPNGCSPSASIAPRGQEIGHPRFLAHRDELVEGQSANDLARTIKRFVGHGDCRAT